MLSTRVIISLITSALLATSTATRAGINSWRDSNGDVHLSNYTQPNLPVFRKAAPPAPVQPRTRTQRRRSTTIGSRVSKSTGRYDRLIREAANRHGVDYKLVKAVIHAESAFNHRAVSSKGAQGLMQLMPATARGLRVSNPFDPRDNVDGGTRYLKQMLRRYRNDISLCLAAYNAGPGSVARFGGVPPYRETQSYIRKVKTLMRRYEHDEQATPAPPRMPAVSRVYHVIKNGRPVVLVTPLP
jgi:soluble lytic murein transglycosylase-like protein